MIAPYGIWRVKRNCRTAFLRRKHRRPNSHCKDNLAGRFARGMPAIPEYPSERDQRRLRPRRGDGQPERGCPKDKGHPEPHTLSGDDRERELPGTDYAPLYSACYDRGGPAHPCDLRDYGLDHLPFSCPWNRRALTTRRFKPLLERAGLPQ